MSTTTAPDRVAQAELALADVHDRLTAGDSKVRPQDLAQAEDALRFAVAQREAGDRGEQQRIEQERERDLAERRQAMARQLAAALERRDQAERAAAAAITALVAASGAYDRVLGEAAPLNEADPAQVGPELVIGGKTWARALDVGPLLRDQADRAVSSAYQAEIARRRAARQD